MLGYVDFSQPSHPLLNGNEDVSEYATGDIGFLNSDGLLFIVSRMSSIVKVKGYRVSISYLESVISRDMPSVQCVVVATAGVESRSMLNLVCVVESLDPEIRNLLKQTIRRKLPTYYHPKYYCVTDRLPLLPNGKYDRRRCLAIANEYLLSNDASVAPLISNLIPPSAGRDTETIHWDVFASFVSDILKLEPSVVVPDANFIHLGGDSIDAIRLSGLLRDNGFAVSALNILDSNTLSDLYESHHDNAGSPSQGINSVSSGQVSLLPLTPSQQRFIHIKQPDPDRWAMTALVRLDGNLSNELIAARISSIVRQSASLQYSLVDRELVFTGQASTLDYSPCEDIVVQDILSLAQPDNKTAHTITSSLLAGLSLSKSRYITWARITPSDPDHRYSCVLLAVHHFFFDAISLSLLVDVLAEPSSVSQLISDPSQLYQILTSSYTIDDSVHATFASYSADLTTAFMRPLHWDSSYSQEQYMSVSMSLSVPLADSTEPPGRFGYLPLFLASLEDSVAKLFNSTCVAVDVETHGRDMNSQYFGTMGVIDYFTCHTPLVLRDQQSNHVDPFHYYSDALSALGRAAINFNLIVASNSPSVVATHPAISINYIPLAAQNSGEASLVIAYDVGASSSPEFLREYPIQFIILETSSGISVRLEYVESLLNDEVISRMLSSIQSSWGILSTQLALGEVCGSSEDPDRLKDDDEQDILTRLFGNP
jgi:aryl carrier-like protein